MLYAALPQTTTEARLVLFDLLSIVHELARLRTSYRLSPGWESSGHFSSTKRTVEEAG